MTGSIRASSLIHTTSPTARSTCSAAARCAVLTALAANMPVIPIPISAGVFGMVRTMAGWPPSHRDRSATRVPAAIESTSCCFSCGATAAAASRMFCGLTAITINSLAATPAPGAAVQATPKSCVSFARAASNGSTTEIFAALAPWRSRPPIRAVAMLPPPMKLIFKLATLIAMFFHQKLRCRCAPWSRLPESRLPGRPTSPSIVYRGAAHQGSVDQTAA